MLYIEPTFVFIMYLIIVASCVRSIESEQVKIHHIEHLTILLD